MRDESEVIYSLERCTSKVPGSCQDCYYNKYREMHECIPMLLNDSLVFLKQHIAAVPYSRCPDVMKPPILMCGNCRMEMGVKKPRYCPWCGCEVKYDGLEA